MDWSVVCHVTSIRLYSSTRFIFSFSLSQLSAYLFIYIFHQGQGLVSHRWGVIHVYFTVLKCSSVSKCLSFTSFFGADTSFLPVYSVMSIVCSCFCETGFLMNTRFKPRCLWNTMIQQQRYWGKSYQHLARAAEEPVIVLSSYQALCTGPCLKYVYSINNWLNRKMCSFEHNTKTLFFGMPLCAPENAAVLYVRLNCALLASASVKARTSSQSHYEVTCPNAERIYSLFYFYMWCNHLQHPVHWLLSLCLMSNVCKQSEQRGSVMLCLTESRPQVKGDRKSPSTPSAAVISSLHPAVLQGYWTQAEGDSTLKLHLPKHIISQKSTWEIRWHPRQMNSSSK